MLSLLSTSTRYRPACLTRRELVLFSPRQLSEREANGLLFHRSKAHVSNFVDQFASHRLVKNHEWIELGKKKGPIDVGCLLFPPPSPPFPRLTLASGGKSEEEEEKKAREAHKKEKGKPIAKYPVLHIP